MTIKTTFLIGGLVCGSVGFAAMALGNETGAMAMLVASCQWFLCWVLEP